MEMGAQGTDRFRAPGPAFWVRGFFLRFPDAAVRATDGREIQRVRPEETGGSAVGGLRILRVLQRVHAGRPNYLGIPPACIAKIAAFSLECSFRASRRGTHRRLRILRPVSYTHLARADRPPQTGRRRQSLDVTFTAYLHNRRQLPMPLQVSVGRCRHDLCYRRHHFIAAMTENRSSDGR